MENPSVKKCEKCSHVFDGRCPHSDGVWITLMITWLLSMILIAVLTWNVPSSISMMCVVGSGTFVLFNALGAGFWFNRYHDWRDRQIELAAERERAEKLKGLDGTNGTE